MSDHFERAATPIVYGWRGWLYLIINFFLGMLYLPLLIAGYAAAFALSLVWIGLPLLALMFSLTRRVAALDRWVVSRFLGVRLPTVEDDLNLSNYNPMSMVGAHLASGITWQSAAYLFTKFPAGLVSLMMAMLIFPFLGLETIMYLLGVNTGMFSGRVVRAMASALSGVQGGLVQAIEPEVRRVRVVVEFPAHAAYAEYDKPERQQKAKRRLSVDEDYPDYQQDDPRYFVGDDGEIQKRKRS